MIAIVLLITAGLCWSIMDTIKHHWNESIFKYFPKNFWFCWFHYEGWRRKYNFDSPEMGRKKWNLGLFKINKPVQITDAWHFFKMLTLFALIAVPFVHVPLTEYWWVDYFIYGTVFNLSFSTGYNMLFKESLWIFLGLIGKSKDG